MIRLFARALLASTLLLAPATALLAQDAAPPAATEIALGEIAIAGAFTRATLPNAPVAGGFLTITNHGAAPDRLVAASASIAKETQIHEMAMEGDVMKMRQLVEGIAIAPGETITLAPGGLHIMFMGLNTTLVEGETVPVTLTFEAAGTVTIDMTVGGKAADAPAGTHGGH